MSESLKNTTTKGILWSAVERFSVQGVQFVTMMVMARLLTPDDYGLIGMLAIFIAVAQSLIDSGFSQALIRKQDRTETDNSTVFYFNIAVSAILYLTLFMSAPLVSDFYETPKLLPVMRAISLSVIINSLAVVQRAHLTIMLDFKTQAKASLIAAVISGSVGILLAYTGYGVWALVWQQLLNLGICTLLLWGLSKWRPILAYSWESFRELFTFGSKLLFSGLLDTLYRNIYPIVIGKLFSANTLGHYTRAQHFSEFPSSNVTGILQRVTYPVLCKLQDDDEKLSNIYRKFLKLSAYTVFPLMMGLAALSKPFIIATIGKQWDFCADLLLIICFSMMWYPIHAINLNLLQVKGRSDLFLRLEIIKKGLGISMLVLTSPFGVIVMCYGQIVNSFIALIINTYYTGKLINVGFGRQIRDLFPTLLLSISMFTVILLANTFVANIYAQLVLGMLIGFVYYIALSIAFKFTELHELSSILRRKK